MRAGGSRRDAPSFTLVIETDNVATAGIEGLRATLDSLDRQTLSPALAQDACVVDWGAIDEAMERELASRYPWLRVHRLPAPVGYYGVKNAAGTIGASELVVLADGDVVYEPGWLEALLAPFEDAEVDWVGGDTICPLDSIYGVSLGIDWVAPPPTPRPEPEPAARLSANNFAARRRAILRHPFPDLPVYRGQSLVHIRQLRAAGVKHLRQPMAKAWHRPPDFPAEWAWRMLSLGSDVVVLGSYRVDADGFRCDPRRRALILPALRHVLGRAKDALVRTWTLARHHPPARARLPLALPLGLAGVGLSILGGFVAVVDRTWVTRRMLEEGSSSVRSPGQPASRLA